MRFCLYHSFLTHFYDRLDSIFYSRGPIRLTFYTSFAFLNGVCRHELNSEFLPAPQSFLNGVCRHEPSLKSVHLLAHFLNGVCRHEPIGMPFFHFITFLNGVCRHEPLVDT